MKKKLSVLLTITLLATLVLGAAAQGVSYDQGWNTSYQVANLGDGPADIVVDYYDAGGNAVAAAQRTFPNVPEGGSVTILQATEDTLPEGVYSAVISANEPIAAVANQQTDPGTGSSMPPFSSYSGASQGATELIIPAVMHNWFGYYTEIIIQNVGTENASAVNIEYFPTTFGGCPAGAAGVTDMGNAIPRFASTNKSQLGLTALGATGLEGDCAYLNTRFLGSARITADQPIVAIANQHVQNKLFTYNGQSEGATRLLLPAYMRNYFGYYAALVIANPGAEEATVDVTFSNGGLGNSPAGQAVVTVKEITVPAGQSITIYDGETGDDTPLAEAGYAYDSDFSFFGTALIESDLPVVAMVNQESVAASGAQAGTYNGMAIAEGSNKVSVPLIQSDFYGYYTSLTIMTVDGGEAQLRITYTSDDAFSSVQGNSKSYEVSTSGGFLNRYEGPGSVNPDILGDAVWTGEDGTSRFIGSAVIEVLSGSDIVAFVNSEQAVGGADSMYTYNAFPMQ